MHIHIWCMSFCFNVGTSCIEASWLPKFFVLSFWMPFCSLPSVWIVTFFIWHKQTPWHWLWEYIGTCYGTSAGCVVMKTKWRAIIKCVLPLSWLLETLLHLQSSLRWANLIVLQLVLSDSVMNQFHTTSLGLKTSQRYVMNSRLRSANNLIQCNRNSQQKWRHRMVKNVPDAVSWPLVPGQEKLVSLACRKTWAAQRA